MTDVGYLVRAFYKLADESDITDGYNQTNYDEALTLWQGRITAAQAAAAKSDPDADIVPLGNAGDQGSPQDSAEDENNRQSDQDGSPRAFISPPG